MLRPRESVQVALTVTGPAEAPVVLRLALDPLPEMVPAVAAQLLTVTGTLSGLVQVQVMFAEPPTCTLLGLAEQLMVGGFFGGSFTVKLALHVAVPFFFTLGSVILAVTV